MRIFGILLAFAFSLNAAPVGNTAAPQLIQDGFFIPSDCWVDLRAGYEGDFVSDARLKQKKQGNGRVDDYSMTTNSGTVTLNILDRLDMYGVLGSSRSCAEWRFSDAVDVIHNVQMETCHELLWAVGARAILFEWGCCDLGFGGRYSSTKNKPIWLTIDGINESVKGTFSCWREWQINLDFSYHIEILTPYVGVKYSSTRARVGGFSSAISSSGAGSDRFETKIPVGFYVGCAFSTAKYFMLNIEGRLIDEEAFDISADFRF